MDTTVEIANKVGAAEITSRVVEDLKDENEQYRKMVMDCIEKVSLYVCVCESNLAYLCICKYVCMWIYIIVCVWMNAVNLDSDPKHPFSSG